MSHKRVVAGVCICLALVAIGIPLQQRMRQEQRRMRREQLNRKLLEAIKQNNGSAVDLWLSQGADPNALEPVNGYPSLWRRLLDLWRRRTPPTGQPSSALAIAMGWDRWHPEVIRALLAHGAKLNPRDPKHPWGDLQGWTLDGYGFGVMFSGPGAARVFFDKRQGETIISALRKAGVKETKIAERL